MLIDLQGTAMSQTRCKGHENVQRYSEDPEGTFYRLSTLKFIPAGEEVTGVQIHLPSRIFRRHALWLRASSVTMTMGIARISKGEGVEFNFIGHLPGADLENCVGRGLR